MSSTDRATKKYTNFTEKEIEEYLIAFKQLVEDGDFSIELNEKRTENVDFMEDYDLNTESAIKILLSLEVLDFCYAVDNVKPKFSHEKLYIFCREFELDNRNDMDKIDIYIKSNITTTRKGKSRLFVVSFHKRNKPISYCFKTKQN
ncbi:hypothetical protein ACFPYN_14025 [Paenisporosarcina macmurdoensis]|uniref:Uncharacterized protein n=1 Tax=Paenisporosarcina macmurdoensis TaxID=212659 RepID=A0ABW1L961_9BACL